MPVPAPASTPESLFADRLVADRTGPLLTFYDDASGERAELSAGSLANWVAKTYFLLTDQLGLGPGDTAFLRLPVHWLAAPVLFGCWYAGLEVVSRPGAQVGFADATTLAGLPEPAAEEVFAVSLLAMARPDTPPPGAEDFAAAVRPMPDAWAGVRPVAGPDEPALDGRSRAELAVEAGRLASSLGLAEGGRLLWSTPWQQPRDWVAVLLAPLAVAGSAVLVRNPDPAALARRAVAERVTAGR